MKFIHTADLHLASPFQGLTAMPDQLWQQIYQSTFTAFEKIVDAAIEEQVDFVLIAGDIYDGERKSIAAVNFFSEQMDRLNQHQIPVFLCYGNHDFRKDPTSAGLPANVTVFPNQVTTKQFTLTDGTTVAVTGFSYDQRWLDDDPTVDYPEKGTVDWQVGMLHGALHQAGANHYAPFTLDELKAKHYDYWALGHIHKHQELAANPPIVYSGNPQGRHKNEGGAHGYYLVHDEGQRLVPTFKQVGGIDWVQVLVDLSGATNEGDVDQLIHQAVGSDGDQGLRLVDLQVRGAGHRWTSLVQDGGLLDHLQDQLTHQPTIDWWPYQVNLVDQQPLPDLTSLDRQYWEQARQDVMTADNLTAIIKPLVKHAPLYNQFAAHRGLADLQQRAEQLLGERGGNHED